MISITYSGGNIAEISSQTYNQPDVEVGSTIALKTDVFQTYDGKSILGWTIDPESTDIKYTNGQRIIVPNTNLTLYPIYGIETLTYSDSSVRSVEMQSVPYAATVHLRTDIMRTYSDGTYTYPIAGWTNDSTKYAVDYADGGVITTKSNLTIYPRYTATMTYSGANREVSKNEAYTQTFILGASITLKTDVFRKLYNQAPFRGWSRTKQNDITVTVNADYSDGQTITPSSTMTIYPLYTATKVAFSNASSITWTETISKQRFYNAVTKTITSICHTVFSTYCEPLIRVVFDASAETADQNKQFDVGIFVTNYGSSDIFVTSTRKQSATTVTGKEHDFTGSKEAYSMTYGAGGATQTITGTAKITPTHFYVM